ncbi:MAG: hypothetical protein AAFQ82_04495, partial [Myxococcota bacterium]
MLTLLVGATSLIVGAALAWALSSARHGALRQQLERLRNDADQERAREPRARAPESDGPHPGEPP